MVRRNNYLGFLKLHLITKHDILSAGVAPSSQCKLLIQFVLHF